MYSNVVIYKEMCGAGGGLLVYYRQKKNLIGILFTKIILCIKTFFFSKGKFDFWAIKEIVAIL